MKLSEILLERIEISPQLHQQLTSIVHRWLKIDVAAVLKEESDTRIQTSIIHDNYDLITQKLKQRILPSISNIVKKYAPTKEVMQDYITQKRGIFARDTNTIDDFIGHKLRIYFSKQEGDNLGAVSQRWVQLYGTGISSSKFGLYNELYLSLSPTDIISMIHNPSTIDKFISTITHELIHLIQSLKSKFQQVPLKSLSPIDNNQEKYFSLQTELEAYTQTIATLAVQAAQRSPDPSKAFDQLLFGLKHGVRTIFNTELFKGSDYDRIQRIFKQASSDIKTTKNREKAWKFFNKRLYSKIAYYKEQLQKN